jgi:threonine aldolase
MAKVLEAEIRKIPGIKIAWKVESNGVFAQIPHFAIEKIKKKYFFYPWIEDENIVRWMCSFDSTEEDVRQFASYVASVVKG